MEKLHTKHVISWRSHSSLRNNQGPLITSQLEILVIVTFKNYLRNWNLNEVSQRTSKIYQKLWNFECWVQFASNEDHISEPRLQVIVDYLFAIGLFGHK